MERAIEIEVLPAARHDCVGLLPWSPLAAACSPGALAKSHWWLARQRHCLLGGHGA